MQFLLIQAFGRNQMLSGRLRGVVSGEFASYKVRNRNWTCLINRPGIISYELQVTSDKRI